MYRGKFFIFSSIVSKYRRILCANDVLNTPNETFQSYFILTRLARLVYDDDGSIVVVECEYIVFIKKHARKEEEEKR